MTERDHEGSTGRDPIVIATRTRFVTGPSRASQVNEAGPVTPFPGISLRSFVHGPTTATTTTNSTTTAAATSHRSAT